MTTVSINSAFVNFLRFPKDFSTNEWTYTDTSVLTIGLIIFCLYIAFCRPHSIWSTGVGLKITLSCKTG